MKVYQYVTLAAHEKAMRRYQARNVELTAELARLRGQLEQHQMELGEARAEARFYRERTEGV